MLIKVEPAGFFMYTVQLIFDLDRPDSEDGTVRDYLTDNELEPRYQTTGEYEGRQSEVMQFGGCYLGRHLQSVGQIQRRAVEVELLTAEVETHLADLELLSERAGTRDGSAVESAPALSEAQRQETIAALVTDFHQESAFQANENGELAVSLDRDEVRAAALRMLGGDR